MSTNFARYIADFDTIDYTPVSAVSAGQVIVIGDLIAVAKLDIAAGRLGALHLTGVYDFPKVTTGGSAIPVGTTVYWNSDTSNAQAASSTYKQLGKVVQAAADGDSTVRVVLNGLVSTSVSPITSGIADPGAAGAIPVTSSGYVDLVTAGAETRTIAAPTFKGQSMLLSFKTKVGNCVVTVASTVNAAGNNTITFSAAGQAVKMIAKTSGANILWAVDMNDGAALSTV
jgi:predicted RecA/RadA family phage recombinase